MICLMTATLILMMMKLRIMMIKDKADDNNIKQFYQ